MATLQELAEKGRKRNAERREHNIRTKNFTTIEEFHESLRRSQNERNRKAFKCERYTDPKDYDLNRKLRWSRRIGLLMSDSPFGQLIK